MPAAIPYEVERAWKAADVLPYFEAEPSEVGRTVTMRDGSTQMIPAEMFGLAKYACDTATIRASGAIAEGAEQEYGRAVDHWLLDGDLPRWWRDDIRMRKALKQNLGEKGVLLYIHSLHEMRRISAMGHWATELWYAARFGVSDRGGPLRTLISVWDDGEPYVSAEGIELFWQRDFRLRLRRDRQPGESLYVRLDPSPWLVPGSVIAPAVTRMFGGKVTVVSGENRLDISRSGIRRSEVTPTGGNLMLVDVPHVLPRAKSPHAPARERPEPLVWDEGSDLGLVSGNQLRSEPRNSRL